MKRYVISLVCLLTMPAWAESPDLSVAIANARTACGGISDDMADLKRMAGINTAVTGVGTAVGVGAVAVGIAKANTDREIEALEKEIAELKAQLDNGTVSTDAVRDGKITKENLNLDTVDAELKAHEVPTDVKEDTVSAQEAKSKKLGNWRTGLLVANTATNVAGVAIAGDNKVDDNLDAKIQGCIAAVDVLSRARMTAQIDESGTSEQLSQARSIIQECGNWESVNLTQINKRAHGAAVASGVGIGVGAAGAVVSMVANNDYIRDDIEGKGPQHEKNLNTAANLMAGGATVASGTATVFNATQIGAIKRAAEIADKCEGVL